MKLNELNLIPVDVISCDVPLFIRLLEYAREDAKSDIDLHFVAENAIRLSRLGPMTMDHYNLLITKTSPDIIAPNGPEAIITVDQQD